MMHVMLEEGLWSNQQLSNTTTEGLLEAGKATAFVKRSALMQTSEGSCFDRIG